MTHVVLCVQNLSVPQDPRVWREATTLRRAGYQVSVVCPLGPNRRGHEEVDGVSIHRYRAPVDTTTTAGYVAETVCALVLSTALVLRLHARRRVAVVHAANPPDTYFLLGWLLRPLGIRFVYDQHDHCPELMEEKWHGSPAAVRLMRVLERLSLRSAHLVVTANDSSRSIAIARAALPEAGVVTVRNGPETTPAGHAASPMRGPAVVRIAYAGRMGTEDGVDVLLKAVAALDRVHPGQIRLDLIGTGEDVPRLRAKAAELGIANLVDWPGWLAAPELAERLSRATIAVSPDLDNAFTRLSTMSKVSEYIASGLAVVAADIPENRVTAADAARYFAAGDVVSLTAAIDSLVLHPEERDALSACARRRAPLLVWAKSAERLLAAYRWLLDGGPPVQGSQLAEAE
jgi:glycosyltransferase involved in cell wall biosynthesis